MTITTITIETVDYTAYASVVQADALLNTDPVRETTWEALSTDEKGKRLVAATRRLNMLNWQGSKTGGDDAQTNAFPRTGLTYPDGSAVSTSEVPQEIEDACILLAGTIAISAAKAQAGTSGNEKKRLKAGSAEIEYFRPTKGKALQDESAWALIKYWISGSLTGLTTGQAVFGNSDTTYFSDDQLGNGLTRGYP